MSRITRWVCRAAGAGASLATVSIVIVVLIQVACRSLGIITHGLDEVVAWLTAAACVMGFGYAFVTGAHVRVEIVTAKLPPKAARASHVASLAIALAIAGFAAYSCVGMVVDSYLLDEVGQGMVALPLWIPQLSVALGTVTLAVAILSMLVDLLRGAQVPIRRGIAEATEI